MRYRDYLPRFLVLLVTLALATLAHGDGQRTIDLQEAIKSLDLLIAEPAPTDLSQEERADWDDQTVWLRSVRDRYAEVAEDHAATDDAVVPRSGAEGTTSNSLGGTSGVTDTTSQASEPVVVTMARTNRRFLALQSAVQQESRKYQTTSNAARARHQVAMNSINNIR
jgi:hypothetical protein